MYMYMDACAHVYAEARIIGVYVCIQVHICTRANIHMYVCLYMYIYIHTSIYACNVLGIPAMVSEGCPSWLSLWPGRSWATGPVSHQGLHSLDDFLPQLSVSVEPGFLNILVRGG